MRRLAREQQTEAGFEALHCIVQEIAAHAGVPQEKFQKHYEMHYQFWYDFFLQRVEDVSPNQAAAIDTRTIADLDIPDPIPPLFGPPGGEKL